MLYVGLYSDTCSHSAYFLCHSLYLHDTSATLLRGVAVSTHAVVIG